MSFSSSLNLVVFFFYQLKKNVSVWDKVKVISEALLPTTILTLKTFFLFSKNVCSVA